MSVTSVEILAALGVEGVSETKSGIESVNDAIKKLDKQQASSEQTSRKYDESMRELGQGALIAGGALLAGFGGAVLASANFDKALSGVAAVSDATSGELDQLRESALAAGAATVFSASDAATAEAELAKAGLSTQEILAGGLTGALNLAAAGQLDLAAAAAISAKAMTQFGLAGTDVGHIADLLAGGANASLASVQSLGEALGFSGTQANSMGVSIEETVGVLSAFQQAGLDSSRSGTALADILTRVGGRSKEAEDAMAALNLDFWDAQGNFVGVADAAGQLQDRLGGLTQEQRSQALTTIFGQEALAGALELYDLGAEGVDKWTDAVNQSGAAQRMAGVQLDNLSGDLEALKGSIETALISGGSKATGALRGMTQSVTGLVNAFSTAPPALQTVTVGFAGIAGVSLTTVGVLGMMIPKIKAVREAFSALPAGATAAMIGVTAALAIGAVVLANWAKEKEEARQRVLAFTDALRGDSGMLGQNTRAHIENALQTKEQLDDLARMKGHFSSGRAALDVYTDAVSGNTDSQREFARAMISSGEVTSNLGDSVDLTLNETEHLVDGLLDTTTALGYLDSGQTVVVSGNVGLMRSLREMTGDLDDSRAALEGTADAERTSADVTRDLAAAETELRDLVAAGATHGTAYADATKKLSDAKAEQARIEEVVAGVTDQSATAAGKAAGATDDLTGSVEDATSAYDEAKDALDDYRGGLDRYLGVNIDAAEAGIDWNAGLDDLRATFGENGLTLDTLTAAGRDNAKAIIEQVRSGDAHADALADQQGAATNLSDALLVQKVVMAGHREDLKATLVQLGLTKDEADLYVDSLGEIPTDTTTTIHIDVPAPSGLGANILEQLGVGGFGSATVRAFVDVGGAAAGAYVPATPGGSLWLVGEGGEDEIIAPVSKLAAMSEAPTSFASPISTSGGDTITHVHIGRLVLPNVRDARDLLDELRNLERETGYRVIGR